MSRAMRRGALPEPVEVLVEERRVAADDAQALPDAVAQHETGVEDRHHRALPRHQVAVDVDQDVGVARVVGEVVGAVRRGSLGQLASSGCSCSCRRANDAFDLELGLGAADPVGALDRLPGLELLVDGEEVLDLQPVELRQVVDVAHVLEPRVGRGHAQHLVVTAGLVGHPVHPDRAALDQAAGERRLADQQHQRVERVAVETEGVLDEAVVGGVLRRGEQRPVEPDPPRLMVDLVLVAAPLRDLHEYVELHDGILQRHRRRIDPAPGSGPVSRRMKPRAQSGAPTT